MVLVDVMMPGLDGFDLRLVRRQSQLPVIMLTARTAKVDRLSGLDAGAEITSRSPSIRTSCWPVPVP